MRYELIIYWSKEDLALLAEDPTPNPETFAAMNARALEAVG